MTATTRHLLIFSFFFSSSLFCYAQGCTDIGRWMDIIKQEYPTLRSGSYMPRGAVENLALNLYSDAYYNPVFGKSFASSSQSARGKSWRKIQTCYAKENYRNDPFKNWVFQSILYNYHVDFRSTTFTDKIAQRNQLRKEFQKKLDALKNDEIPYNEIQILKSDIVIKYGNLFPSEIAAISEALKQLEARAAGSQWEQEFEVIANLPLEYPSIDKALNFLSQNRGLLESLGKTQRQHLKSDVDEKIENILGEILPKEVSAFEQINPSTVTLSSINEKLTSFKKSYRRVISFESVQSTIQLLQSKKTAILKSSMPELKTAIASTIHQEDLRALEYRVLVDVDTLSSSYKQLKSTIEQRRLFMAQEKIRMAKETSAKEQQQRLKMLAIQGKEEGNMQFTTEGMYYAEFYDYVYRGHSENITLEQDSEEFMMIFNAYITSFGKKCPNALPPNKIELMTLECAEYTVTKEVLSGFELYQSCNRWRERGTGIFVKPAMYRAKLALEEPFTKGFLAYLKDMYSDPNAMGNSVDKIHRIKQLQNDMKLLFASNRCTSEGLAQFEKNLLHFATQKPLERLRGMSVYEKMRKAGAPAGKQDIARFIDDIIVQQATSWSINRYKPGSITNLRSFKGQDGKTVVAYKANYEYSNMLTKDTGAVIIRLKDGLPDCIAFADFPNNCKKASASLLMKYVNGDYSL